MTAPSLWDVMEAGQERVDLDPLSHVALTGPQTAFVQWDARMGAWIDANQLGKSFGLAVLVLRFLRGDLEATMPRRFRYRPARVLVIGESYEQMVDLMEKLWMLADKRELRESCGFEEGRGITGKPPRLVWDHGPARGAEVRFATYRAGSKRIAGGTYDLVVCDEPPPESIIGEIIPRLFRLNGYLRIGFTPVPGMPSQQYMKDYIAAGKIERLTFGLTAANLIPVGRRVPLVSEARIKRLIDSLLPHHVPMRIYASLDPVARDRWVPAYDDQQHARRLPLADLAGAHVALGVDHGTVARKQAGCLVAIVGRTTARPRVHVLAETVADRVTGPEDDARAVIDMIRRAGLEPEDVDDWYGDIPAKTDDGAVAKSNAELAREIGRVLGRPPPRIRVPRKGRGSVELECRAMNVIARRGDLTVDPACTSFRRALLAFEGDPDDPVKDIFDAGRYPSTQPLTGEVVPGWTSVRYG